MIPIATQQVCISKLVNLFVRRAVMANSNDCKDELLLAQWQTCVEMANSISQRRDTMNQQWLKEPLTKSLNGIRIL